MLTLGAMLSAPTWAAPGDGAKGDGPREGKMRGGMRGGGAMGRMAKELGLTEAQKAQLKAISDAQRPQMKALRGDETLSREQKMEKMRSMRAANMKKMAAVLTPAQRAKWTAKIKEGRAKREGAPQKGA